MDGARWSSGTAAFGLAALLFVLPLLRAGSDPDESDFDCADPYELEAVAAITSVVGCGRADGAPLRGPSRVLFDLPLDPNTAAAATLEVLPGIGPVRAAAIEAERCRRPFESVAELERVAGIGPKTRARLEPFLSIERPAQARCAVQ